ncbi:MAG TPA: ComEC/Rec2 family competence protein [Trichormus sp.]
MELVPFKYPTFIITFALLALLGDVLALAHLAIAYAFVPALALFLILLFRLVSRLVRRQSNDVNIECERLSHPIINYGWHSGAGMTVAAALCVVPIAFHIYGSHRCQTIDGLSTYKGRAVVVQGLLIAVEKRDSQSVAMDLEIERLLFPVRQDCRCEMHLICFSNRHKGEAVGGSIDVDALSKLRTGSLISAEIVVPASRYSSANNSRGVTAVAHQIWCDGRMSLARQNMAHGCRAITSVADAERTRLVQMHQKCIGAQLGDLLSSMVLGDKAVRLDSDTVRIFRDVGLSHVLAASGFNLTVVIAMTYFIGRLVLRSELLVHALCMLTMFSFVCLAGTSASVMRAAIMCCVMLVVRTFALRAHILAVMAMALLFTLMQDPSAATDVGLQLSYAATTGIVLISKPLILLMCPNSKGFKRWLSETLAVVLASQSAVLPIQLSYFWQIGLMFVPANLLITPILGPVTILGFSSSTIWMICPPASGLEYIAFILCRIIDSIGVVPLQLMLNAVKFLASFEAAKLHVGSPSAGIVVFYVVAWLLLVCAMRIKQCRIGAFVVYACALSALLWRPPLMGTTIVCSPQAIVIAGRDRACTVVCLRGYLPVRKEISTRASGSCQTCSPPLSAAQESKTGNASRVLPYDLQKTCACSGWRIERVISLISNAPVVCNTEDATIVIPGCDTAFNTIAGNSGRDVPVPSKPLILLYPIGRISHDPDMCRLSQLIEAFRADYVTIVGPPPSVADLSQKFCEKLDREERRAAVPVEQMPVPSLRIVAQTVQAATIPTRIKRRTE